MNERYHNALRPVIYVLVVLLVAIVIRFLSPGTGDTPKETPVAHREPDALPKAAPADAVLASDAADQRGGNAGGVAPPAAGGAEINENVDVTAADEESWEFTPEELAREATETIAVRLETERASVGQEFWVDVNMTAPPLQAVVLAMCFDRGQVEPMPNSVESVGPVFRDGVEFFVHPTDGRMTLFCATRPGKKNVLAAGNETVARFRMLAVAAGKSTIKVDEKGIKFLGGTGRKLQYDVAGGEITVRP